ncbi:hypothetical protein GCM10010412_098760 [Nonomuraea recticatena]|uniref:Pyridoxamine 5'-phosphate oxidase putative domain-containing protein n=1 Tax=Nonomuraea recticatena TaxID=46178 RepID=A0ABN3TG28_9ACTN
MAGGARACGDAEQDGPYGDDLTRGSQTRRPAEHLRELGAIRTDAAHHAFATVPRHLFITGFYADGDATPPRGPVR